MAATKTTKGVFATVEAVPGCEDEIDSLLSHVDDRSASAAFALRFGRGDYGVFEAFDDGRGVSADGPIAALRENADLFDGPPVVENVEVLADKRSPGAVSKGLLLRLPIRSDYEDEATQFLREAPALVADEPGTADWFALRFGKGDYGVFDVFPDTKSRRAHMTGKVPQHLALHALPWLSGLPHMAFADVISQKVA